MSKFKLIATNAMTAVAVATLTSMFWMALYATDGDGKVEPAGDSVVVGKPRVEVAEGLVVGPAGLAIPVAGIAPEKLVDTFTQARAGGARVHDAIDIMAPRGTPVIAAAPGRVERLFFSEGGGGITAYVRSPDGRWTYYYAHLNAYAPGLHEGQALRRGDRIGTVGSTGNASPDGPHLHFAILRRAPGEKWHEGSPVNPYPLLAGNRPVR
ncbi:M23 family metallopeptidase [Sphingosinicella rhizophila]|uniref:M23 family metallopeptidase n=1 Tax=Sphingosinicella rhizophila TaxID=3050082 RepID=A0ABU3Q234_9SPHN|nr:M23 family metallopeptidase [Sphingosinicella sp. GR2756]MDT9597470.1 M23 family metallopeptidase [Sphingosinicella sp. GR2756]